MEKNIPAENNREENGEETAPVINAEDCIPLSEDERDMFREIFNED